MDADTIQRARLAGSAGYDSVIRKVDHFSLCPGLRCSFEHQPCKLSRGAADRPGTPVDGKDLHGHG